MSGNSYPDAIWDGTSRSRDMLKGICRAPNACDWDRLIQELRATQTRIDYLEGGGDGPGAACGSVTGLTVAEKGNAARQRTVLTLKSVRIPTTDGTTPATDGAFGSLCLYEFPTGDILIESIRSVCQIGDLRVLSGDDGPTDTCEFELGIGTAATANDSAFVLNGGDEEDIVAAQVVAFTAGETTAKLRGIVSTPTSHDGTVTPIRYRWNCRFTSDAHHGTTAGFLLLTGKITINWTNLD